MRSAKLPPASSSIDMLRARIGRAIVTKEEMLVPMSNRMVPKPMAKVPIQPWPFPDHLGPRPLQPMLGELGDLVRKRLKSATLPREQSEQLPH
jgi:hypothetical protein